MARKHPQEPVLRPALALCGAEEHLHLVLAQGGAVLAAQELAVPGRAMRHTAPALAGLLGALGLTAADLTGVAVVRGPGSFTGLRMTMAMALGLARAAGLPLAGLDYLPLLAAGPAPLLDGTLAVVTHSRGGQVYMQPFAMPDATPLAGPAPMSLEQAAGALAALPGPCRALGSGLRNNADFFAAALPELARPGRAIDTRFDQPLAHVLARAAASAAFGPEPPAPLYLRASDAEDNLAAIAAGRGLDPAAARRRLIAATSRLDAPAGCPPLPSAD